jgi:hypothetical protein
MSAIPSEGFAIGRALESLQGGANGGPSAASIERFQQAFARATDHASTAANATSPAASILNPLLNLNGDSMRLAQHSTQAAAQAELRPSDLMMLTMRSHEFMFHCEFVANVANRSSDGVQQLFRQQS